MHRTKWEKKKKKKKTHTKRELNQLTLGIIYFKKKRTVKTKHSNLGTLFLIINFNVFDDDDLKKIKILTKC